MRRLRARGAGPNANRAVSWQAETTRKGPRPAAPSSLSLLFAARPAFRPDSRPLLEPKLWRTSRAAAARDLPDNSVRSVHDRPRRENLARSDRATHLLLCRADHIWIGQ